MKKKFAIDASSIRRFVPTLGGCIATDAITVSGHKVGFMTREQPRNESDSGWAFMAGTETQEYIDDPNNLEVYDVNTIANYDPEVIPFLLYPPGTEIERSAEGLRIIKGPEETPQVSLLFPAFPGRVQINQTWSFEVSSQLFRRLEDGSLVLWRPGFTIWLNAYSDSTGRSPADRLAQVAESASEKRYGAELSREGRFFRFRYFLDEDSGGSIQKCALCFGFTEAEELHLSIYFDTEDFLSDIDLIWSTLSAKS